ncbi:MAG: chorismate mutase [Candidatus Marinimicrobia bacterium]|nr:chorismate mutase [Candidatus Neomarinimicrobiota bacterium]
MTEKISEHRKNIDDLDLEILKLIQDRIDQAIIIRGLKTEQGIPLFTPNREKDLINRLIEKSAGRLPAEVVEDIWKTIIKGGKRTGDIQ